MLFLLFLLGDPPVVVVSGGAMGRPQPDTTRPARVATAARVNVAASSRPSSSTPSRATRTQTSTRPTR